jgi:putative flippase GtrA
MQNPKDAMPRHRYSIPMYIGVGGVATASHYVTTIAAVELAGVQPLAASAAGFAVGAVVKYWLSYFVTFRSAQSHAAALPRFVVTLAILFAFNAAFFALFNQWLGLHYLVAQVLTTVALIPPGYIVNRLWVFRSC